ncbi:MAG TPA: hydroxymethylbilane synthase [Alphaproteobacteria bacterium]|nr:hydroxymethylbilane synthase [Alphaproteobacteria bacterium]
MSNQKRQSLKIGTRNSPLALVQANMLADALKAAHPSLAIEIIPMTSAADWKKQDGEKSLCEQEGGKGQFAKEIEKAILAGEIDCGVHSLKDMASVLPEGLAINHVMPRADARDAFISVKYKSFDDLPEGAVVGTCSPRRMAIALHHRPDIKVVPFRGNVQTRLDKVRAGQVDATFLAMAGLTRLNISDDMIHPLPVEVTLPACGQGIVCVETKTEDLELQEIMNAVHCHQTGYCAAAERAVLAVLDGSCHTPIAAYAMMQGGNIYLRAEVLSLDGTKCFRDAVTQPCQSDVEAQSIGTALGMKIKTILPEGILT